MFNMERRSPNASQEDIPRSSPISVPSANKSTTSLSHSVFPVGSLQAAKPLTQFVRAERFLHQDTPLNSPELTLPVFLNDPIPSTPMPGTNLTFEDIGQNPGIVVTSPSAASMDPESYFPITEPKHDGNSVVAQSSEPSDHNSVACQAHLSNGAVSEPFPFPQSPDAASESNPPHIERDAERNTDPDAYSLEPEARKSLEEKNDFVNIYLAQCSEDSNTADNQACGLDRRRSTWGRHTGLYDGTGYATSDHIEPDCVAQAAVLYESTQGSSSEDPATSSVYERSTGPTTPRHASLDGGEFVDAKESVDETKSTAGNQPVDEKKRIDGEPADQKNLAPETIHVIEQNLVPEGEPAEERESLQDILSVYSALQERELEEDLSQKIMDMNLGG